MKRILVLLILLSCGIVSGQALPDGVLIKSYLVQSDRIQIDSLSINPGYFKLYEDQTNLVNADLFEVDYAKAILYFKNPMYWKGKKVRIAYLP